MSLNEMMRQLQNDSEAPYTKCNLSALKDLWLNEYLDFRADKQTHKSLTVLGANWLMNNCKCRSVLLERGGSFSEMPDAFGLAGTTSYLIEAKASRADFLSDAGKSFRVNPSEGMGQYRYYICPKDMIKPDELPEKWGLLYVGQAGRIRKIKDATCFTKFNRDAEFLLLSSALASPWKMYQHWTVETAKRFFRIDWVSKSLGTDIRLFASRMAVNTRIEQNND